MDTNKKTLRLLFKIFMILLCLYYSNRRIVQMYREKKFNDIVKLLKKDNIILNKKNYKIRFEYCLGMQGLSCYSQYSATKKRHKFRSKYLKTKNSKYIFARDYNKESEYYRRPEIRNDILKDLGLFYYVVDEFIYDKSRGNNFEEIEKIFKSYKKTRIYFASYGLSCRTDDERKRLQGEKIEIDYKKTKQECDERFSNYFREYFSSPTKIEEVDWEKYMEMNKIYPKLTFTDDNLTKAEVEELNEKIKPYYNKDLMNISIIF